MKTTEALIRSERDTRQQNTEMASLEHELIVSQWAVSAVLEGIAKNVERAQALEAQQRALARSEALARQARRAIYGFD